MSNTSRSSILVRQQPSPRLRIEVIGACRLMVDGREIDLQSRKARAVVGALALADNWKQPRETFHGLLWGESEPDRARASLRNAVYDIQKAFNTTGCRAFDADKQTLAIDRSDAEVDVWEALDAARRGEAIPCLLERDRITETLLSDLENVDPGFRDWLIAKRQSLHGRLTAALEDALRRHQADGVSAKTEALARSLIKLDPTNEEAVRALILARTSAGDLGGAFTVYKTLWDLLDKEFEIPPSKETQDLIAKLRMQQPETELVPGPAATVRRAPPIALVSDPAQQLGSVARHRKLVLNVGGFDVTGVSPEHRYLISGFRHELSACLVRFREWSVRDQAHTPAGASRSDPRDGEYTIDASAFEASEGVRLVLMLRNSVTNDYVWSERLQLSIATWFEAQQQVVRRLASALNVHLSAGRLARLNAQIEADPSAFDLWLQGQTLLLNHNPLDWDRGVSFISEAIRRMPNYSPAYAALANAYNTKHISQPGALPDSDRTKRALECAKEAVRLDPVNARAQLCLAWSHVMARQTDEAMVHASLANELNDSDTWISVSSVNCRAMCGVSNQLKATINAMARDEQPGSPVQWSFHSTSLFLAGNYPACVQAADRAGQSYHMAVAWKAAALALQGEVDVAKEEMRRFVNTIRARWIAAEQPSDEAIAAWFMSAHPICHRVDWQILRDGAANAGLPVEACTTAP